MKKRILTMMAASGMWALSTNNLVAQNPGDLDTDFGTMGYVHTDHVANTGEIYTNMITLPDDKIVMVGYSNGDNQNILVARFMPDGSPDLDFANYGALELDASIGANEEAFGVTNLSNGQLLITGIIVTEESWDGFIMRLNEDGTVDESFGTSAPGRTNFNAGDNTIAMGREIIVLQDNSILVGGSATFDEQSDLCVFKFTQGGGMDMSFASSGVASLDIENDHDELNAMTLTSNGQILLGGTSLSGDVQRGVVAQLSSFGTPTTFAGTGYYLMNLGSENNEVNDLMVDSNDKIVAVGSAGEAPNTDGVVFRLNTDGSIDESFSTDGYQSSDPGATTTMRFMRVFEVEEGGILACGYTTGNIKEAYAFLMQADGTPDSEFGGNGDASVEFAIVINTISGSCAALQSNGAILIGGDITSQDFVGNNLFIVRIHTMGSIPDYTSENTQSDWMMYPNPVSNQFQVQSENEIQRVALYTSLGTMVATWNKSLLYELPSEIANGTYILTIGGSDWKVSSPIIVNR